MEGQELHRQIGEQWDTSMAVRGDKVGDLLLAEGIPDHILQHVLQHRPEAGYIEDLLVLPLSLFLHPCNKYSVVRLSRA